MARAPLRNTRVDELPTIIIDPSLYQPERTTLLQSVCEGFIEFTKTTVVLAVAGTAAFAITQGLEPPSRTARSARMNWLDTSAASDAFKLLTRQVAPALAPAANEAEAQSTPEVSERAPAQIFASVPEPKPTPASLASATSAQPTPALVDKAIAKRPLDLEEGVRSARRLLALNRLEDAEAAYRKVLIVSDSQPAALVGLARVQLARGYLDEALTLAERAVDRAPKQIGCHLTLGDVLRARGAKPAANAQYQLAALLRPTIPEPSENLLHAER